MESTTILSNLFVSLIVGFSISGFSWLFYYSTSKGQIFEDYLVLLSNIIFRKDKNYKNLFLDIKDSDVLLDVLHSYSLENSYLYKILGGCIICFNMWFSIIVFTILSTMGFFGYSYYLFLYIFVGCMSSSFFLRMLLK